MRTACTCELEKWSGSNRMKFKKLLQLENRNKMYLAWKSGNNTNKKDLMNIDLKTEHVSAVRCDYKYKIKIYQGKYSFQIIRQIVLLNYLKYCIKFWSPHFRNDH